MLIQANSLQIPLKDSSVQCVVTSPPYWGLRDYGLGKWECGDAGCNHKESRSFVNPKNTLGPNHYLPESNAANQMHQKQYSYLCKKCGATRSDAGIGLESTPEEYVLKMVDVFREVRRVLKKDGTVWVNLGDSYAGGGRGGNPPESGYWKQGTNHGSLIAPSAIPVGLKPKDLCGIPWRVAFALQADGWWLRSDIIWSKPNPMPESVTDRPTKAHEYLFLLSKSANYYYDAEAIKEGVTGNSHVGRKDTNLSPKYGDDDMGGFNQRVGTWKQTYLPEFRNRRSVWTIATQPYPEAHFATFPEELVTPCILAGSRIGDTVFDPFVGSGTTVQVAEELGRNGVGIDLKWDYLKLAQHRLTQSCLKWT